MQRALVLRKNRRAVWGKLAALTAITAGLGLTIAEVSLEAAVPVSLAVWAVMAVLLVGSGRRARIILTEHEIIVKGLLVRRRRSRAHAARVVRATIVAPQTPDAEWLLVLDAHGNVLMKVAGDGFTTGDLDRFVDALGLPCSGPDHPVKWAELGRMYPGLMSWSWRHSTLLAILIVSAITLLIAAVVIFLSFSGHLPEAP